LPDNHHKVNKLFILAFFAVFARKDKNTGSNSGPSFFALFFAPKRILAVFLPPDLHHKILILEIMGGRRGVGRYSNGETVSPLKTTSEAISGVVFRGATVARLPIVNRLSPCLNPTNSCANSPILTLLTGHKHWQPLHCEPSA
jgi:hypothetical protein